MSNVWLVLDISPDCCGHCSRCADGVPAEIEADSADSAIAAFAAMNDFTRADGGWASEDGRVWEIVAWLKED